MKILIGIPSLDGKIPFEIQMFLDKIKLPEGCTRDIMMTKRTIISTARNLIAKRAIEGGYDYLLFLDDDNYPERPDALQTLIENDMDIVVGYYKGRTGNNLVLYNKINYGNKFTYKTINHININNGYLQEIGAAGAGFMLIKTSVLIKLFEKFEGEIFEFKKMDFYRGKEYLFDSPLTELDQHFSFYMGEDICFCHRAMEEGFKTFVDLRVPVFHIGNPEIIQVGNDKFSRDDRKDVTIISEYDITDEITKHCTSNYEFLQGNINELVEKAAGNYIIYMDNILLSQGIDTKLIKGLEEATITGPQTSYGVVPREGDKIYNNRNITTHCRCMKKEDLKKIMPINTNLIDFSIYDKIKKDGGMCGIMDARVHLFPKNNNE